MANAPYGDMLAGLTRVRDARSARASLPGATTQANGVELDDEKRAMRARCVEDTRRRSELNREQARQIRKSFR